MNDRMSRVLAAALALLIPSALPAQDDDSLGRAFKEAQGAVRAAWGDASIDAELRGAGVTGLIHAAVPGQKVWVLSVYSPSGFKSLIYPLRPADAQAAQKIAALKLERHDSVRVTGRMKQDPPHIEFSDIVLVKPDPIDYSRQTEDLALPSQFPAQGEFEIQALVHAVLRAGRQVAVEYQGNILPLTLDDADEEKAAQALDQLWRGDIIKVTVRLRSKPGAPRHLVFSGRQISVVDPIRGLHGKSLRIEGYLVSFPKSPVLTMDEWAVAVADPKTGVTRYFILANLSDKAKWEALNQKLKAAWDARKQDARQARNKFINQKIVVRVQGTVVDLAGPGMGAMAKNQANPTFDVTEPGDAQILP